MLTLQNLRNMKGNLTDETLIKIINKEISKAKKEKRNLYKLKFDCRSNGCVNGLFKATATEIEEAMGKNVVFGEVLGKHSYIFGTLEKCDIELISDDPYIVSNTDEYGFNPLHYLEN